MTYSHDNKESTEFTFGKKGMILNEACKSRMKTPMANTSIPMISLPRKTQIDLIYSKRSCKCQRDVGYKLIETLQDSYLGNTMR